MTRIVKERVRTYGQLIANIGGIVAILWVGYQLVNMRDSKAAGQQEFKDRVIACEKELKSNNDRFDKVDTKLEKIYDLLLKSEKK